jgi:hypothetical protein
LLALALLFAGLFPQGLAPLIAAAVADLGGSPAGVAGSLMGPLRDLGDLRAAATALVAGGALHLLGQRLGVYGLVVPWYLSLDASLRRLLRLLAAGWAWLAAERAAFETTARRLIAHERVKLAQLGEVPPRRVSRAWLRLRVSALALVQRASRNWASLDAWTRAWARRLDESARLLEEERRSLLQRVERQVAEVITPEEGQERFMRSARDRIARESRDLSLNIGVLLVVWLLFLGALWLG